MTHVELHQVTKRFGSFPALESVSLAVPKGQTLVVVGPSGSGKTTLLRVIAGLESVTSGTIRFDATDMTRLPASRRHVALVSAQDGLWPHWTIEDNLLFADHYPSTWPWGRRPSAERRAEAWSMGQRLGLSPVWSRPIQALSSGERQRVALGRAFLSRPRILLLDEPFARLDPPLRCRLRHDLADLARDQPVTTILVTHDSRDAFVLANEVAVLVQGRLAQLGPPLQVAQKPVNPKVAQVLGDPAWSFIHGYVWQATERSASAPSLPPIAPPSWAQIPSTSGPVTLAFRCDRAQLAEMPTMNAACWPIRLRASYHFPTRRQWILSLADAQSVMVEASMETELANKEAGFLVVDWAELVWFMDH